MKFKPWKKLSYRQKQFGKAFYTYFKQTGQFSSLSNWENLPVGIRDGNLPVLHNYIATTLSSLQIPKFKNIPAKCRAGKKYYEFLVDAVTGAGEVFGISGVISYDDDGTDVPIDGAIVTVDDETVTTEDDGAYSFTGLTPGVYIVKVSAEGFENKTSQVTISNADVTRNLTLTPTE